MSRFTSRKYKLKKKITVYFLENLNHVIFLMRYNNVRFASDNPTDACAAMIGNAPLALRVVLNYVIIRHKLASHNTVEW